MPQELLILNPEKTVLSFPLARIGSRITAQILDWIIIFAIIIIASRIAGWLGEMGTVVLVAAVVCTPLLYFILLEGLWNGQTLGKKANRLRVRMADGTPVTFGAAIGRNLMRAADMQPFFLHLVGIIAMFTNTKSQRMGDLICNTIVTLERRAEPRFTPAPYVLGVHPFEAHVGELRGMTADHYIALKQLCDRFPELPAPIQNKLITSVWEPFSSQFEITPLPDVHAIYLAEAVVMKYGRSHGLL